MKKKLLMFVFLFSINFIYPQEQLWPVDVEIYVIVQGLVDGNQVGFKMTAQSSVWELSFYPNSWEFTGPTNLYNLVYYPTECQTISNTPIPWNSTNTGGYNILGGSNSWHSPSIGHGLYKFEFYNIYCEPFQYYFYIDYRDCDYPMRSRPDGTISPYSNSTGGIS